MQQNTDEWLKFRHNKIGASDAVIIMNQSKYMTRAELLLQKTTKFKNLPEQKSNPIADLGHIVEDLERPRFEFLSGKSFMPSVLTHPEIEWLSASYDGLSMDESEAWESKLVGKDIFAENECPEKFYPQIQQQFLVNPKLKKNYLCMVLFDKKMLGKVDANTFQRKQIVCVRDEKYINEKLMPELTKFRQEVLAKEDFSAFVSFAERREKIKLEIKHLQDQLEVVEKSIKNNLENVGQVATGKWVLSYLEKTKTSYDTKQIFEDYKVDLDKYKKVTSFRELRVKKND